jgi:hypothetical protein
MSYELIATIGRPGYLRFFSQKGVFMNKCVFFFIMLLTAMLCIPGPCLATMTALTDVEMTHVTGQKGIATLPGDTAQAAAMVPLATAGPADLKNLFGPIGLYQMAQTGLLPLDTPLAFDLSLTGEDAEAMAIQGLTMAAGAASLVNPIIGGFSGLGMVPGAFDVAMGDVSIQMSGTIELSIHP